MGCVGKIDDNRRAESGEFEEFGDVPKAVPRYGARLRCVFFFCVCVCVFFEGPMWGQLGEKLRETTQFQGSATQLLGGDPSAKFRCQHVEMFASGIQCA